MDTSDNAFSVVLVSSSICVKKYRSNPKLKLASLFNENFLHNSLYIWSFLKQNDKWLKSTSCVDLYVSLSQKWLNILEWFLLFIQKTCGKNLYIFLHAIFCFFGSRMIECSFTLAWNVKKRINSIHLVIFEKKREHKRPKMRHFRTSSSL